MNAPIRVLIADDHALVREGLRALLSELTGFEVAAEAATGTAAVEAAALTRPDVVVMDLKMPGLNGIEATRRIVEADATVGVLVVTMLEDDQSVFAAMRAGARGYLLKGAGRDDIVRAIESVAQGESVFGAPIGRRITEYFATPAAARRAAPFPDLSESRARDPRSRREGTEQQAHRQPASPEREDGPKQHLEHLQQAPSSRPRPGDRASPRGRPRPRAVGAARRALRPLSSSCRGTRARRSQHMRARTVALLSGLPFGSRGGSL
jgi:DNA-binding NarL/FixJ family response regulator